ncbi:hypothetical protein F5Y01DRAFT_154077 [Xylaria sp. FL0043]|nr:hypothetical protein F5Y01DRAFT_154077 [Xylaria sp. FL0043]
MLRLCSPLIYSSLHRRVETITLLRKILWAGLLTLFVCGFKSYIYICYGPHLYRPRTAYLLATFLSLYTKVCIISLATLIYYSSFFIRNAPTCKFHFCE